jgi:hypothetical protein
VTSRITPNEPGHLVLARLLLAQGDAVAQDALLDRLEGTAAGQQRVGSLIEIRAIRAMALAALGDEPGAVAALTSALDLGCPQGYVRVFADEGPAMAAVLGRLIAAQRSDQRAARIPLACLARLQRAFGDGHPAGGPASGPGGGRAAADARVPRLIDQLTSRELEVLAMLAAGRSNQGIAKSVGHLAGHGQEARQPPDGQAGRGEPNRGGGPGPRARADQRGSLPRIALRNRIRRPRPNCCATRGPSPTSSARAFMCT